MPFYQYAVIQGSNDDKVCAAEGMGVLIHTMAPTTVVKYMNGILGRLLRITYDKPPTRVLRGVVEVINIIATHVPTASVKTYSSSILTFVLQKALPDEDAAMRLVAIRCIAVFAEKHSSCLQYDVNARYFADALNAVKGRTQIVESICRGVILMQRGRTEQEVRSSRISNAGRHSVC